MALRTAAGCLRAFSSCPCAAAPPSPTPRHRDLELLPGQPLRSPGSLRSSGGRACCPGAAPLPPSLPREPRVGLLGRRPRKCGWDSALRVLTTTTPSRQGQVSPGGHGPASPLASMAGRPGSGPGASEELRYFRLPWLVGASAPPHPHPAGALVGRPSRRVFDSGVLQELRPLSGSLGSSSSLLLRSRRPGSRYPPDPGSLVPRPPSHPPPLLIPPSRPAGHLGAMSVPPPLRCSRVRLRSHFCGRGSGLCSISSSPIHSLMAWDCLDSD